MFARECELFAHIGENGSPSPNVPIFQSLHSFHISVLRYIKQLVSTKQKWNGL